MLTRRPEVAKGVDVKILFLGLVMFHHAAANECERERLHTFASMETEVLRFAQTNWR
jgi:hypothetical protein